jgi:hypothetical protein
MADAGCVKIYKWSLYLLSVCSNSAQVISFFGLLNVLELLISISSYGRRAAVFFQCPSFKTLLFPLELLLTTLINPVFLYSLTTSALSISFWHHLYLVFPLVSM